jgi:hypothetical protein
MNVSRSFYIIYYHIDDVDLHETDIYGRLFS